MEGKMESRALFGSGVVSDDLTNLTRAFAKQVLREQPSDVLTSLEELSHRWTLQRRSHQPETDSIETFLTQILSDLNNARTRSQQSVENEELETKLFEVLTAFLKEAIRLNPANVLSFADAYFAAAVEDKLEKFLDSEDAKAAELQT